MNITEVTSCRRVRIFKWDDDSSPISLPSGFGLFTAYLQTATVFSSCKPTIYTIPHSFLFDLSLLSSLDDSFVRFLTQQFRTLTPQYTQNTAFNIAIKVKQCLARNFAFADQSTKVVIVADVFYQANLVSVSGSRNSDVNVIENVEFGPKKILSHLCKFLEIPSWSIDMDPVFLVEVPGLERFQGVEFTDDDDDSQKEEKDKCCICLEELISTSSMEVDDDTEKIVRKTECSHLFHGNCLAKWLWRKPSCPMCRLSF
ncbi:hypothetical protein ACFE04_014422 [Oxalis oulophora]